MKTDVATNCYSTVLNQMEKPEMSSLQTAFIFQKKQIMFKQAYLW